MKYSPGREVMAALRVAGFHTTNQFWNQWLGESENGWKLSVGSNTSGGVTYFLNGPGGNFTGKPEGIVRRLISVGLLTKGWDKRRSPVS